MRKLFMLTGWIGLVCACGDAVPEPDRVSEETEVAPESTLVDAIDHEGEHIEFWEVGAPGETEILMTTLGYAPGVLAREDQDATPAEIWLAATGRTDVPDALLRDHERARSLTGDSFELHAVNIRPPRAELEEKALTPAESADMFPTTSGSCYQAVHTATAVVNSSRPDARMCSFAGSSTDLGLTDSAGFIVFSGSQFANDCAQTKEIIRVAGHYRDATGGNRTAQFCFMTGGALFSLCNPALSVPPTAFVGSEFGKSSTSHALKLNISALQSNGTPATDTWIAGAAFKINSGLRAFQKPTCN